MYYRYPPKNIMLTVGVKNYADTNGAYWLLDAIVSHQTKTNVRDEPFQVWTLSVRGINAILTATDGGKNGESPAEIARQYIEYTDHPPGDFVLWVVDQPTESGIVYKVIMLPSEY